MENIQENLDFSDRREIPLLRIIVILLEYMALKIGRRVRVYRHKCGRRWKHLCGIENCSQSPKEMRHMAS